jgi:single-strand DNA-binding protein
VTEDTNVSTVVGRLTKNAELKLNTGLQVGFFTIATNRKKKNTDGSYAEEASFLDVNVYGKYAEAITPKLKKGTQVCVVGSLKQDRWINGTGETKSRVVITADTIQIFGGNNNVQ